MEYHVPQFIEVEDKIVGPLTLKQFIYLAGTGGLCVVFFVYLPIVFAFLASAPVIAFGLALTFYKVNGKPFIEMLEAGFNYYTRSKLFLWKHGEPKPPQVLKAATPESPETLSRETRGTPKLTRGKLSELAWSLDVRSREGESGAQQ